MFFTAFDDTNGRELWKSDGTEAGTVLVKDIRPGNGASYPSFLTNPNGTLFFSANDGTTGFELWKSDGTEAGTVLVKDIFPGSRYGYPNSSLPYGFTNVDGILFFSAKDGVTGRELWMSDGTAAGTVLVQDIFPGNHCAYSSCSPNSSSPYNLTNINGALYFSANDGLTGREPWKLPLLSIDDVTVTESDHGVVNAVFTVRLSAPSSQKVKVHFATADGTATAGKDYTRMALPESITLGGETT